MPYTLPLRQKLWCFTIYYLISTPYIHRTMNTPKYFWIFLILSFLIPLCNPFAFAIAYICFAHAPHPLCVSAVWFGGGGVGWFFTLKRKSGFWIRIHCSSLPRKGAEFLPKAFAWLQHSKGSRAGQGTLRPSHSFSLSSPAHPSTRMAAQSHRCHLCALLRSLKLQFSLAR